MRLVSQNNMHDINYDSVSLSIVENNSYKETNYLIEAKFNNGSLNINVLGTYSTLEKCLKVMEMVRKQYADSKVLECFNTGMMHEYAKCNESQVMCVHNRIASTFIFQFPADEDVTI